MSNLITSRQQVHQTYLVQHFFGIRGVEDQQNSAEDARQFRFPIHASAFDPTRAGLGMRYDKIQAQAWLLAYNDAYRLLAMLALLCAHMAFLSRCVNGSRAAVVTE